MYLESRTEEGWRKKKEYTKNWMKNISSEKQLIYAARARAKRKGLEFDITEADVLVPTHCPILGIPLFKVGCKQTDNSPSIDRRDNNKGYIKGNVWVISYRANHLKGDKPFT